MTPAGRKSGSLPQLGALVVTSAFCGWLGFGVAGGPALSTARTEAHTTATASGFAHAYGLWSPGRYDTCPKRLHDSFVVRGPDGKLYPTWHPPRARLPNGEWCTFGHEHGRDPRGSRLYGWRHEDHVGHKIEWQNDVPLERSLPGGGRRRTGVRCDFLVKIHQGTHSADAFGNNLHELIYAVRCSDGTALIATLLSAFGAPNQFVRACDKRTVIAAGTAFAQPASGGARLIPDASCVRRYLLVPAGRFSDFSRALYEDWLSANYLRTLGGRLLAYFDPHFAVFNPSRYASSDAPPELERSIATCWLTEAGDQRARGGACDAATRYGARTTPLPFDSPESPFDGTHREVYFNQTVVDNAGGPVHWWTDPFGGQARRQPFPGAIRQYLAPRSNRSWPTLESQAFGARRPYDAPGVHAPN